MLMRVVLSGVVLAVVLGSAPASAQVTAKAAVKQAKAAAKTRLGLFKTAVDGAQTTAIGRIDAFDVTVRGGGFTIAAVQGLAEDLHDFQTAVEEALFDVAVDTARDGQEALAALAGGGMTLDEIPLALANLPGGLPDQVRTAVGKLLAKADKALNKRLAKTSALVGTAGDATFFAVLGPPPQLHFAFSHVRSDAILFDLAIDLRMSARVAADTRLWVGGTTAVSGIDLVVSAVSMHDFVVSENEQVTSEGRGRFLARIGDGTELVPTNYLLGVVPSGGMAGASASSSFAVR